MQIQQQLTDVVATMQAQAQVQRGPPPPDGSIPSTPTAAGGHELSAGAAEREEAAANEESNARTQNSVAPSMPGIAEDAPVVFNAEDSEEAIMAGSKNKQVYPPVNMVCILVMFPCFCVCTQEINSDINLCLAFLGCWS